MQGSHKNYKGVSYRALVLLEEERKLVNYKLTQLKIFMIFIGIIFFAWYVKKDIDSDVGTFVIGFLAIIYEYLKSLITKDIRNKFKIQVVLKVVKDINPNFLYFKDRHINQFEFGKTGIYSLKGRTFVGDDLISGTHNDVYFKMSDVNLYQYESRNKSVKKVDIFKGVVFISDFYKEFISHTFVLSNRDIKCKGEKILVDNVMFNENFVVYTNNKINAFYILSPTFMEQLLKLKRRFNCDINIVFYKNKIYIYIDNKKNNFEIDLNSSLLNIRDMFEIYKKELECYFRIIDDLRLNSKIFKV